MTTEQLKQLEDLGAAFMGIVECAIILEMDTEELAELVADETSDAHRAYHKGRLMSEYQVRRGILKSAADGSSPAQTTAMELLEKMNMHNA